MYFDRKVVHVFSVELELVILGEVDHGLVVVSLLPPLHRHLLAVLQQRDLGVHVLQVAVVEVILEIKDVTPPQSLLRTHMSTDRKDAFEEDDADDVLNDGVLEGDVEKELGTWFSVHVQPRVQPTQIYGETNRINKPSILLHNRAENEPSRSLKFHNH